MKMFIINCKNYREITEKELIKLVAITDSISRKYRIKIAIAPPVHLLGITRKRSRIILAQHVDNKSVGSTTGFVIPELLADFKINGSLINHSEHRISNKDIYELILRLKILKMISIVCIKNINEAKKIIKFNPDYIAIEPSELIGTGRSISSERPELITGVRKVLKNSKSKTKLLCGAGIISGNDVKKAFEFGSDGILVASGVVKSKNMRKIIEEFAREIPKY